MHASLACSCASQQRSNRSLACAAISPCKEFTNASMEPLESLCCTFEVVVQALEEIKEKCSKRSYRPLESIQQMRRRAIPVGNKRAERWSFCHPSPPKFSLFLEGDRAYRSLYIFVHMSRRLSILKQPILSVVNDHLIDYPTPSNLSYWWGIWIFSPVFA